MSDTCRWRYAGDLAWFTGCGYKHHGSGGKRCALCGRLIERVKEVDGE